MDLLQAQPPMCATIWNDRARDDHNDDGTSPRKARKSAIRADFLFAAFHHFAHWLNKCHYSTVYTPRICIHLLVNKMQGLTQLLHLIALCTRFICGSEFMRSVRFRRWTRQRIELFRLTFKVNKKINWMMRAYCHNRSVLTGITGGHNSKYARVW